MRKIVSHKCAKLLSKDMERCIAEKVGDESKGEK